MAVRKSVLLMSLTRKLLSRWRLTISDRFLLRQVNEWFERRRRDFVDDQEVAVLQQSQTDYAG